MPVAAQSEILEVDELVDRVIQAYGGAKLKELNSLQVHDRYKVFSIVQGADPDFNSISLLYSTLTVDYRSGKKSVKNWSQNSNGNRLSEILFDGNTGWSINHLRGTHVENKSLGANVVGSGMQKMLDTILVLRLLKQRDTATIFAKAIIEGELTYTLMFKDESKQQYFIDIDTSSNLILRMSQKADRTTGTVYEFGKHTQLQGLTFATDMNMLVNGSPRFITTSRKIEVNNVDQHSFSIPTESIKLKGMLNNAQMQVKKLANNVYLVGENTRFSIFVDTGDFYIGGGGLSGMKKRLHALNKFLGTNKSIKVQVIPDHHRGHLGAIKELEEMGAHLVIAPQHRQIIESLRVKSLDQNDFSEVDESFELADGLVKVYDIQTTHAKNYLLFYVPNAKLIFSADHFGTNLIDALPSANNTMKTFHKEIKRLGLPVELFAHAHGSRTLSNNDLINILSGFEVKPCPPEHDICID